MKTALSITSKNFLKKSFAFLTIGLMFTSSVAGAQARVLFQDDFFEDVDSEGILIDANGGGAENTSIQFGNDVTPANNGTILWDVTDDEFQISNTIDLDGFVDMRNADAVHIQESPDPDTVTGCDILGEIILDTTDNEIQICTAIGADSVQSAGSVVVTAGTGGDTYDVIIGGVGAGGAVPFNTSLAQTAIDIAADITANIAGYSAEAVGTTVNITADIGGVAGDATVATTVTGTATTTDNNTTGGVDGGATWTAPSASDASTLDGLDSTQFLRSDTSDNFTAGTLTFDAGTTVDIDGDFNASGSTEFIIPTGTANSPGDACTAGEIYFDTDTSQMLTCGAGGTFEVSSPQDFEDVYAYDADDTLTTTAFDIDASGALGLDSDAATTIGGAGVSVTSDGGDLDLVGDGTNDIDITNGGANIDIDSATLQVDTTAGFSVDGAAGSNVTTSAGDLTLEATAGSTNVNGGEAAADAVRLNASNAAGGIDIDAGTAGVAIDTTGGFSVDGDAASNISTSAGDLSLVGGGELIFDDGDFADTVQLSEADTTWDGRFGATIGLIDNLNDVAAQLGGDTVSTFDFSEATVLADDDTVYAALEKLNNKWGDLASTTNGEGASLIGIEDAAGNITATTVEGALSELAAQSVKLYENILLYPEYPDTVLQAGGATSRGKMETDVDGTEGAFYKWTTRRAADQTFDIITRIPVPEDFAAATNILVRYRTILPGAANNSVEVVGVFDDSGVSCGSAAAAANTSFATHTIVPAVCTITAGEFIEVQTRVLADNTATAEAHVGRIEFNYTK